MTDLFEEIFADWLVQSIQVSTWTGDGATGPHFNNPATVTGVYIEDAINQMTDQDGNQVISRANVYVPSDRLHLFTPGSRVTSPVLNLGVQARVVNVSQLTVPELPSHGVVYLG